MAIVSKKKVIKKKAADVQEKAPAPTTKKVIKKNVANTQEASSPAPKKVIKKKVAATQEAPSSASIKVLKKKTKRAAEEPAEAVTVVKKAKKVEKKTNGVTNKKSTKVEKLSLFDDEESEEIALPAAAIDEDSDALPDDFDSDVSDEEGEELAIEKKSKALDRSKAKILKEGEEELQLNIANLEKLELPTMEQLEEEIKSIPNMEIVKQRISDVIQVLGDFKARRDPAKSREDYVAVLSKDLCTQYGYNEYLITKFMHLFPNGAELMEFLEANDNPRPVTIRANTLKVKRGALAKALIGRGMNVDPAADWTKVGLVVYDSQVPVGATPEYLAGHYMIQGLNSLLPVMALAPQPGDRVLDMCSAPGGKTSHIAALMKNSGVLFANDFSFDRCRAIIGNLHRLGVINAVISNLNGEEFAKIRPNGFDRILLDAPCSGTGVIWKDQSVKTSKDSQDIQRRHTMQRKLILAACDALDANSPNGGYLVYSTCSVLVEENEAVVNFLLERRHVEIVPTGLPIGVDGFTKFRQYRFHPSLAQTKRYYPHVHNIDGFYVAKIKKLSNAKKTKKGDVEDDEEEEEVNEVEEKKAPETAGQDSDDGEEASDDEGDGTAKLVGGGQRKAKKKRNQVKAAAKKAAKEDDDGFNTPGYLPKAKKVKPMKLKVNKRSLARSSAKAVKSKRKKMLEKL